MNAEGMILVAVARVARTGLAELTGQFLPLAKTTAMESKILVAVARADLAVIALGPFIARALALGLALVAVVWAIERKMKH